MDFFNGIDWWMVAGAVMTWIIVILGVGQLARFYTKFVNLSKELDANMLAMSAQLKKIQSSLAEIIIEQRRASRLMLEQVDLKKAELTGDFEIVEEPIQEPRQQPVAPGITLPK